VTLEVINHSFGAFLKMCF